VRTQKRQGTIYFNAFPGSSSSPFSEDATRAAEAVAAAAATPRGATRITARTRITVRFTVTGRDPLLQLHDSEATLFLLRLDL
jgi:hypothetical protein